MTAEASNPAPGAARDLVFPVAQEADLLALGLPVAPPPDWRQRFLAAFARALERHRAFRLSLDACLRCGACAQRCPFYLGTGDPLNTPVGRAELARGVYRRYLAPSARRLAGWLKPPPPLSRQVLDQWYAYFHQCSLCRRCALYCPLGLDTSQITLAAREILAELGLVPGHLGQALGHLYRTGNHLQLAPPVWTSKVEALERRLQAATGQAMACPVDEQGAEVLLVVEAGEIVHHPAAFMAYAKAFHAAGLTWTTTSFLGQASNLGHYLGYRHLRLIARRLFQAADHLRPRYIVWGESGQGWAVGRNLLPTLAGPWSQLPRLKLQAPLHIHQLTLDLLERGAFMGKLRRGVNHGRGVTYHDPCQAARSAGLIQEPRALLKAACDRVVEMPANTVGERTLCCGAGGGLMAEELRELRLAGLLPRAKVLAWMAQERHCQVVATACHTCQRQLDQGLDHYGVPMAAVGVMELFGQALYPTSETEAGA